MGVVQTLAISYERLDPFLRVLFLCPCGTRTATRQHPEFIKHLAWLLEPCLAAPCRIIAWGPGHEAQV